MFGCRMIRRRRAAHTAVLCALFMTVLMAFAALAIDITMKVTVRQELQFATDSAALGAAALIANQSPGTPAQTTGDAATDLAAQLMGLNVVAGLALEPQVTTGMSVLSPQGRMVSFTPASEVYNSVRVQARLSALDGTALSPILGQVLGQEYYESETCATALLPPRDIMLVYDRSESMSWDSRLVHLEHMVNLQADGVSSAALNLEEVWQAMALTWPYTTPGGPQGIFHPDYVPGAGEGPRLPQPEGVGPFDVPQVTGHFMNRPGNVYGTSDVDMASAVTPYDPREDPGLAYLPTAAVWPPSTLMKLGVLTPQHTSSGLLKQDDNVTPVGFRQVYTGLGRLRPADFNGNSAVGSDDLSVLLVHMGPCPDPCQPGAPEGTCLADLDFNCVVNSADLSALLGQWGAYGVTESDIQWHNRVGTALGLYTWTPTDHQDVTPGDEAGAWNGELSALDYFGARRWDRDTPNFHQRSWWQWIEGMREVVHGGFDFSQTFGIKTFADRYIKVIPLILRYGLPLQPDRRVKQAVAGYFESLAALDNNDRCGLVIFSDEHSTVQLFDLQPAENFEVMLQALDLITPSGHTATGPALQQAVDYLIHGQPAAGNGMEPRTFTRKEIVLLTDGRANEPGGTDGAWDLIFEEPQGVAHMAAEQGVVINTITLGFDGHWNEDCVPESQWHLPYEQGGSGCGLGQSLAYLTHGHAMRVLGDAESVGEQLTEILGQFAWRRDRPVIVGRMCPPPPEAVP